MKNKKQKKKREKNVTFTTFFITNPKWQVVIDYYQWEKSNFNDGFKLELVTT